MLTVLALGGIFAAACSSSRDSGFEDGSSSGGGASSGTFGNGNDGGANGKTCVPDPANYDIPDNNCDDDG
ncbi:MAG: hypothetical protein KF795_31920, partial [Labilithrix sp.]|nr:hypothetical protein [Labilithrix sp.]